LGVGGQNQLGFGVTGKLAGGLQLLQGRDSNEVVVVVVVTVLLSSWAEHEDGRSEWGLE